MQLNKARSVTSSWKQIVCLLALGMWLTGCGGGGSGAEGEASSQAGDVLGMHAFNLNKNPLNKVICDPFSGGTPASVENGLKATLFYRTAEMPRYYRSTDYINLTYRSNQSLFFSDLNVPTRLFTQGFSTQTSDVVKNDQGERLIEYFGLRFETELWLRPGQTEGRYELGTLADDGITVRAKIGNTWTTIISSDLDTPTRMGCSNQGIEMRQGVGVPLEITYYQGPRTHIAAVLMWRGPGGDDPREFTVGSDVRCNQFGNHLYFNPDAASAQQPAYIELLNRKWRPIPAANFILPASEEYNPCVVGTGPTITNFAVSEAIGDMAFFRWNTDLPATSQIIVTDSVTGEQTITNTDNALRVIHGVMVRGLQPGRLYYFRALSITQDLGRGMSAAISLTTVGN